MTDEQFRTLVRAVFVAGWMTNSEASADEIVANASKAADRFLEKEGFSTDANPTRSRGA